MRRALTAVLSAALAVAFLPSAAAEAQSQSQSGRGGQSGQNAQGRERQAAPRFAPLRRQPNAGPCPYVKILYDAARYTEMVGSVSAANVAYTGEIEGLSAGCAYQSDEPIRIDIDILFHLGRGPQAQGEGRAYRYWIAVTERNSAILAKEYFDLPVTFPSGTDRVYETASQTLLIPRAAATTSGSNFEVLIGFDVTPEMAEFNRSGSRFRINAGQTQPQSQPAAQ